MKKTFSSKKSAFSLIELSIVLIIIGLLIAGVTGGASLIKSSELRSAMGEARGYAVAVNAFYTQYNALPGDYNTSLGIPASTTGNPYGDYDAKIEFCTTGCVTGTVTTGSEGAMAWQHLKYAGGIDTAPTFTGGATASQAAITNYPGSKIRAAGWGFDYNSTSLQNVVVLTSSTTVAATVAVDGAGGNTLVNGTPISVGALVPADALSIDKKIDDGIANTGKVQGILSTCFTTTAYLVATTTKACPISYQVDVTS